MNHFKTLLSSFFAALCLLSTQLNASIECELSLGFGTGACCTALDNPNTGTFGHALHGWRDITGGTMPRGFFDNTFTFFAHHSVFHCPYPRANRRTLEVSYTRVNLRIETQLGFARCKSALLV